MKWEKMVTTAQEYEETLERLSKIFEADADSAEGMEAELLVTWIDKYKKEQNPIVLPDPIDATRETMKRKGFKDKDLIPTTSHRQ